MKAVFKSDLNHDASPLESRQEDEVSGLSRRGPPPATGGTSSSSCGARRRDQEAKATGQSTTLKILQWNCEGIQKKKEALRDLLTKEKIDVACIQETHLNSNLRLSIRGYQCFRKDRENRHKGGVAILVSNTLPAENIDIQESQESEIIGIKLILPENPITIFNCYSPPDKNIMLHGIDVQPNNCIVVGDFNSHSPSWGYNEQDAKGEDLEDWQVMNNLHLLYDPEDPPTFFSRAWKTTSNPDLAFVTNDLGRGATRTVQNQLASSDHKPIMIELKRCKPKVETSTIPRWNFKKADWELFTSLSDHYTARINCKTKRTDQSCREFVNAIMRAAKESIPRGARKDYFPNWSNHLRQLNEEVTKARSAVEKEPTTENNISLKRASAQLIHETNKAMRKSWQDKTSSLNFEKDGHKLWNLVKSLNGDKDTIKAPIVLNQEGKSLTGREAADALLKQYQSTGKLDLTEERQRQVETEVEKLLAEPEQEPADDIMKLPLTMVELNTSISQLKKKSTPGPDKISNGMLSHLGNQAKKKLLQIYNASWKSGHIPKVWKRAVQIPIHKQGKPRNKAESYRPISLTSCLCKLMERILNHRLIWYLEKQNMLINEQAGFRKQRSTEDQVTYISQLIEDGFQKKQQSMTVWLDLEKAFEKVWTEGLILKLIKLKVSHNMLRWIIQFVKERTACVSLQGKRSHTGEIRNGVPQGGVLSPTLFLIFLNDIKEEMTKNVQPAGYADDMALICTEDSIGTAQVRLQSTLDNLATWTASWGLKINTAKTTFTIFSLSPKTRKAQLHIEGQALNEDSNPTYLGVKFDPRLTWNAQVEQCRNKGLHRTALLKKLAGSDWGADHSILRKAYTGYVRPVLEYGIAAWGSTADSHFQKISKVQNQNLRIITGAMRSTPILAMETISEIESMKDRRDMKQIIQLEKMKRMPHHPMKQRTTESTKSRIKRTSFLHNSRKSSQDLEIPTQKNPQPINILPSTPWKTSAMPPVIEIINDVDKKSNATPQELSALTDKHLDKHFPRDRYARVYTDGSANEAVRDGGGGIYIEWNDGTTESHSIPTGKYSTNYKAEIVALEHAVSLLLDRDTSALPHIVLLTDAKSVLQALASKQDENTQHLKSLLCNLNSKTKLTVQWVPGHCNVPGNEIADSLAKTGSKLDQVENNITFPEIKTITKATIKQRWRDNHPDHNRQDPYHLLGRSQQVTIFRLRVGHNKLRDHMHKLKATESAQCRHCHQSPETAHHILQECLQLVPLRQEVWDSPTCLQRKLYGSLADLQRTADYMKRAEIQV